MTIARRRKNMKKWHSFGNICDLLVNLEIVKKTDILLMRLLMNLQGPDWEKG